MSTKIFKGLQSQVNMEETKKTKQNKTPQTMGDSFNT